MFASFFLSIPIISSLFLSPYSSQHEGMNSSSTQPRRNINHVMQKMKAIVPLSSPRVQDVTHYEYDDYEDRDDSANNYSPTMLAHRYTNNNNNEDGDDDEDEEMQQVLRNRFFNRVINNTQHTMPVANPAVLEHIHISNLPGVDTSAATTTTTTTTILTNKKGGATKGAAVAAEPPKNISLDAGYNEAYTKCVIQRRSLYKAIGHDEAGFDNDESGDDDEDDDDDDDDVDAFMEKIGRKRTTDKGESGNGNKKRKRTVGDDGDEESSSNSSSGKKRSKRMVSYNDNNCKGAVDECFLCTWGNEYYDGMSVPHIQEMFRMVKSYHGQMRNTDLAQMIHLYYKEHVYDPSQGHRMLYPSMVQDHLENHHSLSAATFVVESMRRYQKLQFICSAHMCLENGSVDPKQFAMFNTCQTRMEKIYHLNKASMILDPKYNPEELNEKARDINITSRFSYQDEQQSRLQNKRLTGAAGREATRFEF